MKYLLIIFTTFCFSQTQVDLSNMTKNIILGDQLNIQLTCGEYQEFVSGDIDFNGLKIILNNVKLTVNGDIQFGGSFLSYCESTLCINGTITNTDPKDPGGNPFDINGIPNEFPDIPSSYEANICLDLPNDTLIGWYQLYDLIQSQQRLSVNKYILYDNLLDVENVDWIEVYNILGKRIKAVKGGSINLEHVQDKLLIIRTNLGSFKIIKQSTY